MCFPDSVVHRCKDYQVRFLLGEVLILFWLVITALPQICILSGVSQPVPQLKTQSLLVIVS